MLYASSPARLNHHHGIQSEERFGLGRWMPTETASSMSSTTADVTAVTVYQVTLNVPGQVIPNDPDVQAAIAAGQQLFSQVDVATAIFLRSRSRAPTTPALRIGQAGCIPNRVRTIRRRERTRPTCCQGR